MVDKSQRAKFQRALADPCRKSLMRMAMDCLYLFVTQKDIPRHYFSSFLYRRTITNIKDYVSVKESRLLHNSDELHTTATVETLKNKLLFQYFCEANDLPVPKLQGFFVNGDFFDRNGNLIVNFSDDMLAVLTALVDESDGGSIFIKPMSGLQGRGCMRLDRIGLYETESKGKNQLCQILRQQNFIVQETLIQHQRLADLYPGSINTIRFETFTGDRGPEILTAFLRLGRGGSIVDNGSSGGCFVGIELDSGRLKKHGFQLLDYGGAIYEHHPDTKVRFEGFKLPFFDEAKSVVLKAAKNIGDKLVGWDIGITPTGPVLIEGNNSFHIQMSDITFGGLKKHPQYSLILQQYARL